MERCQMTDNPCDGGVSPRPVDCMPTTKLVQPNRLKSNFKNGVSEEIVKILALMFVDHVTAQENSSREESECRGDL